jgi:hypothetical protein
MTNDTLAATEQEEIRHQIDESRAALVEKLGILEDKVAETVQNATSSVAEATASVLDTVNNATASVSETVESVNAAVQGTVKDVTATVSGTVESVRDTFDFPAQFKRHPWGMFAGAVAAGFFAGRLTQERIPSSHNCNWSPQNGHHGPGDNRNGRGRFQEGNGAGYYSDTSLPLAASSQWEQREPQAPQHVSRPDSSEKKPTLADVFGNEMSKLKGLAIGVSLGLVRDMLSESAPESFRPQIAEIIDDFTQKLGGERIHKPILATSKSASTG